jgi:phosphopantothenoylcysteine decarboxylase/phosphopantothenate--cysteine ligase
MRLLIGVSGGIAAYKAIEAARLAVRDGHAVRVIQTPSSQRFVGRASFAAITGAPVLVSEFETDPSRGSYPGEPLPAHAPISHLELVQRADVYLIAPASANTIAKLATGAADNLVTTAALAAACPVAVAPAMNSRMYLNAATQANVRTLTERGIVVIPPGEGELASHGEQGVGRLAEPTELLAACLALHRAVGWGTGSADAATASSLGPLSGLHVLVTAGGTQEPIDSVRFVGNRSSGRMGYALAVEALARGAQVTIVSANVKLEAPAGAELIPVATAAELAAATYAGAEHADIVLMAAAVADFRPVAPVADKLKKSGEAALTRIELEPTEDVLSVLAAERRDRQLLIGFAAEHGERAAEYGREKLKRKQLDAIVVNDISRPEIGFDSEENEVLILTRDGGSRAVPRSSKAKVATTVLDEVQRLREVSAALLN